MSSKFNEYEREREEKDDKIKKLESKAPFIPGTAKMLADIADRLEKHSRRNTFIIHDFL